MVTSAVIKVDSRACCTSYSAPVEPNVKTSKIVNHIAVVTGGGRGLGRAMVLGLAQAGIQVIATAARERTEVEAVAEEVRQACGESRVLPLVADVTQEDDCAEVVVAASTGVTVNALLPGGPTLTGMVPQTLAEQAKSSMLDPSIIVPPLLWLVSPEADGITGRRFVATKWQTGVDGRSAAEAATEQAGW
jgi:NAD(P)-dependent dehydrogenase (short-subunit alcohol dehydrogenase family)